MREKRVREEPVHEGVTLDLLRHGACQGGAIYRGRTDTPLSEAGWRQMRSAVAPWGGWQTLISSPLGRCRCFCEALAGERDIPWRLEPRLRELDFGAWDGQPLDRIWNRFPEQVQAFWRDPVHQGPPGSEPFAKFVERLEAFIQALDPLRDGAHLLVVTHAGVIRQLLAGMLQVSPAAAFQLQIGYASLSRIRLFPRDEGGWHPQIEFVNRLPSPSDYDD